MANKITFSTTKSEVKSTSRREIFETRLGLCPTQIHDIQDKALSEEIGNQRACGSQSVKSWNVYSPSEIDSKIESKKMLIEGLQKQVPDESTRA